jgi:selenocysteine lyase/cysteine desulfurase
VFTGNTTHAIDLCSHVMADRPGKVITTEMEHHSNELTHRRRGGVLRCRVDDDGNLDMGHLDELLHRNDVKLVAVTGGSNITGVMPDVHRIARMAHENADPSTPRRRRPPPHRRQHSIIPSIRLRRAAGQGVRPFGAGFLYGPRAVPTRPAVFPRRRHCAVGRSREAEYPPARHHGGTPNVAGSSRWRAR